MSRGWPAALATCGAPRFVLCPRSRVKPKVSVFESGGSGFLNFSPRNVIVAVMSVCVVWLAVAAPPVSGGAMGNPDMGSLPLLVAARGSGRVEDQEPAEMDSEAHPEGGAGAAGRRAVTGQQGARRHQALVRSQLPGQTW